MYDGLTVGHSLTLVAIGRACYAASKRAFAERAKTTTLGQLGSPGGGVRASAGPHAG